MADRVRETHDLRTVSRGGRYTESPSSGLNIPWSGTLDVWSRFEEISDVTRVRATVKPVTHRKARYTAMPMPSSAYDVENPWYVETYESGHTYWSPPDIINHLRNGLLGPQPPSSGTVGELADKAFDAFFTQVPQEVDIANFLIDFREIGSLIPSVQRNIAATIGGGFLTYSFGWKPLIGDLQKLGSILETTRKRLAWLRSTYGKPVRLGFSSDFVVSTLDPANSGSTTWTLEKVEGRFNCNATLRHQLQRLDGLEGELRGLVAALGLNSPGKIIWERIPFSFIVDWVSRVGRLADRGTIQPFTGSWDVSNVVHSFKQRAEYKHSISSSYALSTRGDDMGVLVIELYGRGRGIPLSSALFYGRELTPQQLALSAALIGAASK